MLKQVYGPAIASGNQVYNGICADFPQAPMNKAKAAAEIQHIFICSTSNSRFKVA
jgi:hypothetical protein